MKIKADEISSVLKQEIEGYAKDLEMSETGQILEVGDGIARIYGLKNAMAGELLEFPHGVTGLVLNLEEASVGAVLLGDAKVLREGDMVKRTKRVMSIPVGPNIMLDQERCILCTRCVRFLDEVTDTHELTVTERGDRSELEGESTVVDLRR